MVCLEDFGELNEKAVFPISTLKVLPKEILSLIETERLVSLSQNWDLLFIFFLQSILLFFQDFLQHSDSCLALFSFSQLETEEAPLILGKERITGMSDRGIHSA